MNTLTTLAAIVIFPAGLFLLANGLVYDWIDRKLVARMQNRLGPRWFQPFADMTKLFIKEDTTPQGAHWLLFHTLPVIALAAVLTAALFLPLFGLPPLVSFSGDLVVTVYLLSLLTLCIGLAGQVSGSRYTIVGAARVLTQLFAYEAPFLLALLGPALVAESWQLTLIMQANASAWILASQPIGFVIAVLSLMGKLEMPPFDAPEAETEIVAGALTEYGGAGLALFLLAKKAALVSGLTLIAALYLGGIASPLDYLLKTLVLLLMMAMAHAVLTRFRIDQTASLWWRWGLLLMLAQWALVLIAKGG